MRSLRHKLWLGFGGLLLILVVVSVMSVVVLTLYGHALEQVFHDNYNSAVYCDAMKGSLDQLNNRAQQLIWQEQEARQIDATTQEKIFSDNLGLQLNNITIPGEAERTTRLARLWDQFRVLYAQFDAAPAVDRPVMYRSDLLPRYEEIKRAAQEIADMNMSTMISVDGRVKQTLLGVRNALLGLVITGTLVASIVVSALAAAILRPLAALTRLAGQVASGNLEYEVHVESRDEMGQLAEAFNVMSARLREFRRLDHDKLARTQQTTQLAIDSLPDAVFVIGPEGAIEISNRKARQHFGIEPGLTVKGLALKWLTSLYEEVSGTGHATEEPQGYQSAIQLFEGVNERFLLPRAMPMVGEGGRVLGVTVILVDVTRLHSADEAKSSLVSTVSHELRTPLTSIRMALSLLGNEKFGAVSPKQTALLKAAREDSDRLNRIVENLLGMSRIESGRAKFELRPTAPAEIVAQAVDPLRAAFAEKKVQLDVSLAADLPAVLADPIAVGTALTNLLSNALKFTPGGGTVVVAAAVDGNHVAFTVSDTGPGIPAEYAGRVFEKFFRVPRKDGPSGAGLGLAIAREVIDANGGAIALMPSNGSGCTFRFTLQRIAA